MMKWFKTRGVPSAVGGAALLGGSWLAATPATPSHIEHVVFVAFNDAPAVFEPAAWGVMQLGNVVVALACAGGSFVFHRDFRRSLSAGAASVLAWQLAKVIKELNGRGRPAVFFDETVLRFTQPSDPGFPSGHTAVAFAVCGALALGLPRRYRVPLLLLASLVGAARMYVGVHLPLDVLGGAGLGLACAGSVWGITEITKHVSAAT